MNWAFCLFYGLAPMLKVNQFLLSLLIDVGPLLGRLPEVALPVDAAALVGGAATSILAEELRALVGALALDDRLDRLEAVAHREAGDRSTVAGPLVVAVVGSRVLVRSPHSVPAALRVGHEVVRHGERLGVGHADHSVHGGKRLLRVDLVRLGDVRGNRLGYRLRHSDNHRHDGNHHRLESHWLHTNGLDLLILLRLLRHSGSGGLGDGERRLNSVRLSHALSVCLVLLLLRNGLSLVLLSLSVGEGLSLVLLSLSVGEGLSLVLLSLNVGEGLSSVRLSLLGLLVLGGLSVAEGLFSTGLSSLLRLLAVSALSVRDHRLSSVGLSRLRLQISGGRSVGESRMRLLRLLVPFGLSVRDHRLLVACLSLLSLLRLLISGGLRVAEGLSSAGLSSLLRLLSF